MLRLRYNRKNAAWPSKLVATLAFALCFSQWVTLAHAAAYGFEDHNHGGVACEVSIVSEKLDDLIPADTSFALALDFQQDPMVDNDVTRQPFAAIHARPRGPPSLA
jgi:hypothetical protein